MYQIRKNFKLFEDNKNIVISNPVAGNARDNMKKTQSIGEKESQKTRIVNLNSSRGSEPLSSLKIIGLKNSTNRHSKELLAPNEFFGNNSIPVTVHQITQAGS